jgi:hypothetical protein
MMLFLVVIGFWRRAGSLGDFWSSSNLGGLKVDPGLKLLSENMPA